MRAVLHLFHGKTFRKHTSILYGKIHVTSHKRGVWNFTFGGSNVHEV